ncbi:3' terminal RNA ribose 2'-O-methyltransferase Hen1 [Mycoplana sp. MJR14]|uniref:3' terminal RNA ribose 2'-O-methyltransferase Hen1 n=1 Tax=Mycoplana sp. MJR14 TaxID=3032583 RepID=UPI0023DCA50F|nr:3' terminal RNA ribose 2'-O-methyltransferase Hen1 [Mycoplana sp. MJR14]MDF1632449.1 3' terminal RNA ribose 2'-O-methyltransferase Hen1 [Mycoplana sp. MJR14]
MFLSIATTYRPAADLGFLLMKHPDRVHGFDLSFGKATVFFPEASEERCEVALVLDVDPVGLVRGRGAAKGLMSQYVNDRPYAASSFLSVALNRAFRTAFTGTSEHRPELAVRPLPLEINVTPLPGSNAFVHTLFEPLGWTVEITRLDGSSGPSGYVSLSLKGEMRLSEALSHLYVLIPVLDAEKHYWVGEDEVAKLIERGGAWLPGHPAREQIASRYLRRQRSLTRQALARLAPDEQDESDIVEQQAEDQEELLEERINLHDLRLDTVLTQLVASGASTVADLGCGEGKLLHRLARERQFQKIIGLDASMRSLERAAERLKLDQPGSRLKDKVALLHGALTYRDVRWHEVDAAALVEVVEHLDQDRLPAFEAIVFGQARPRTVVLTTPNRDYNVLFPNLPDGSLRHADHRFEWSREEFRHWVNGIEDRYGYSAHLSGIGPEDDAHGSPTQMAVLTR